jgi:hypothetical protein
MTSHQPAFPANWSLVDLVVDGARIEALPVNGFQSYESIIQVAEADAPLVISSTTIALHQQTGDRVVPDYLPLARFSERAGTSSKYSWSCIAGSPDYVSRVAGSLTSFIENAGRWLDLATMFKVRYGYDPHLQEPAAQPTIRWFWLTVPLGGHGANPVQFLEDAGLFVDPGQRLVPVFSNRIDAVRLAKSLKESHDLSLQMYDIPCLGCFLNGVAGELGRDALRGAILDGQWRIDFNTCDEHGARAPSHFIIDEGAERYHLIGCAENGWPRWAGQKWMGKSFPMTCELEAW